MADLWRLPHTAIRVQSMVQLKCAAVVCHWYATLVTVHMFVVVHRFVVCVRVSWHRYAAFPMESTRLGMVSRRDVCILRGVVVEGKVVGWGVSAMAALLRVLMVCKSWSLARPAGPSWLCRPVVNNYAGVHRLYAGLL